MLFVYARPVLKKVWKSLPGFFLVLVFTVVLLGPPWTPASPPDSATLQIVRFEHGGELAITSWEEKDGWVTFLLATGGEIGVEKDRVEKVETVDGSVHFVIRRNSPLPSPSPGAATGSSGGGPGRPAAAGGGHGGGSSTATGGGGYFAGSGSGTSAASESSQVVTPDSGEDAVNEKPGGDSGTADSPSLPGSAALTLVMPGTLQAGQEFSVDLVMGDSRDVGHINFYLLYPVAFLEFLSVENGGYMQKDGKQAIFMFNPQPGQGTVVVGLSRYGFDPGLSGSGTVLRARFRATAPGQGSLVLDRLVVSDPKLKPLSVTLEGGALTVLP